ncbi:MAG TPA: hypothetical protein VLH79_16000 [Chthonomonadales bacterium]|nr:hypothetical protein [Chthonomonadales bacterium]
MTDEASGQASHPKPEWSVFFSAAEWRRFIEVVCAALESTGRAYRIDAPSGVVYLESGDAESALGLTNLAQMCHAVGDPGEWPEIVARHFQALSQAVDPFEAGGQEALEADFDRARPVLKVRLYPVDYTEADLVAFPVADGIIAALTYDLPQTVVTVRPEALERWGTGPEALFEQALDNVWSEGRVMEQPFEPAPSIQATALVGESFFTATHALMLDRYLIPPPDMGAIVAIPTRHTVLYAGIRDASVVASISVLSLAARGLHADGPGSVSPGLYWWRPDGSLLHLPIEIRDDALHFRPPGEFVEQVLDRLE